VAGRPNAAAKRWILKYAKRYKDMGATILGDDLYSCQPLCQLILDEKLNFILVCKPESHKTLSSVDRQLKPEINQIELHPYLQQPAMLDFCRTNGIHLTAYSPLGSSDRPAGLKAEDEPVLLEDSTIADIAGQRGITPAQVLISWAIHRGTSVIPKSVNPARMKQNLAAAEVSLTEEDMQEIACLDRNRRYVNGEFWALDGSPYTVANIWDE